MIRKWAKRWALFTVALPVAAWALDEVGDVLEQRKGSGSASKGLHKAAGTVREWRGGGKGGGRRR